MVNLVHRDNVPLPIVVILSTKIKEVREEQERNVLYPKVVVPSLRTAVFNPLHSAKA